MSDDTEEGPSGLEGLLDGPDHPAPRSSPPTAEPSGGESVEEVVAAPQNQATELMSLVDGATLYYSSSGTSFASVRVDGRRDIYRIDGRQFKGLLRYRYYESHGGSPQDYAVKEAAKTLQARARFEGEKRNIPVRVTQQAGNLYLDLGDDDGRVVRIDDTGWEVTQGSPVTFWRPSSQQALPQPAEEGSMEPLRELVPVEDEEDWRLIVAWLVACLQPEGPYPILVLRGPQGAGKSTTARMLRKLVDPVAAPLREPPSGTENLVLAAERNWVLGFDNISRIRSRMSDAFCRLCTGGAFGRRTLYEDNEETVFSAQRPLVLNGIPDFVRSHDLLDRCFIVRLPELEDMERRREEELWREFEAVHPEVLAGLLDAAASAWTGVEDVDINRLPRMADAAAWVTAAEPALGWDGRDFLDAYEAYQAERVRRAIEEDPFALAVLEFAREEGTWSGTMTELLEVLDEEGYRPRRSAGWPSSPSGAGQELSRAESFLSDLGVDIERDREGAAGTRVLYLTDTRRSEVRQEEDEELGMDWEA